MSDITFQGDKYNVNENDFYLYLDYKSFEALMGAMAPPSRKTYICTMDPRFTNEVIYFKGNLPCKLTDLVNIYL